MPRFRLARWTLLSLLTLSPEDETMPLNLRRIIGFALVCAAIAACGDIPTVSADGVQPSLDGGHTLGSGHRTDSTTTATSSTETVAGDSTGRGGHTLGSGH